jgi:hypothetical protein
MEVLAPPRLAPLNADCTLHHAHWLPSHPRSHYSRTLDRHERSIFLLPRTSTTTVQYSASSRYSHSTQLLRTCSSCPCALCPALPCLALPCPASYFNALWLDRWYLLAYLPTSLLTYLRSFPALVHRSPSLNPHPPSLLLHHCQFASQPHERTSFHVSLRI